MTATEPLVMSPPHEKTDEEIAELVLSNLHLRLSHEMGGRISFDEFRPCLRSFKAPTAEGKRISLEVELSHVDPLLFVDYLKATRGRLVSLLGAPWTLLSFTEQSSEVPVTNHPGRTKQFYWWKVGLSYIPAILV